MVECTLQSTQKSSYFRAILRPMVSALGHREPKENFGLSSHGLEVCERAMLVLERRCPTLAVTLWPAGLPQTIGDGTHD